MAEEDGQRGAMGETRDMETKTGCADPRLRLLSLLLSVNSDSVPTEQEPWVMPSADCEDYQNKNKTMIQL